MNTITIPRKLAHKENLVVVEKSNFRRLAKENIELRKAIKAVVAGELALRRGEARTFKAFLRDKFPQYAKDK